MDEKRIEEELASAILLAERVRAAVNEATSFKAECTNVAKLVDSIAEIARLLVRFTTSASQPLYERPVRRMLAEACKNLLRALTLVRKCRRRSVLRRVVTIIGAIDFRKVLALLEASAADMKWLISSLDTSGGGGGGVGATLPPIASNDPTVAWVWSSITPLYMASSLVEKIDAANQLTQFAKDNNRNKQIIVEEGAVQPALKLLKEADSPEAQVAAATLLCYLANDRDRVRAIVNELGAATIVKVLAESPMKVQICVANLVARMAENDPVAQDDFARQNAIRPLVTLLSFETFSDDQMMVQLGKQSIHSIVQINKQTDKGSSINGLSHSNDKGSSINGLSHSNISGSSSGGGNHHLFRPYKNSFSTSFHSEGSSRGGHRKERENEMPEVKHQLKISCAEASWMLARGSVANSKKITETKGLLCLAKLVEMEKGELQYNCLMTIQEVTAAAEFNADLRRAAFKTNSPAAKAVVDQLLRVIKGIDSPAFLVPAIKSIGSLARTFPSRETRVIVPLVDQLGNRNQEVAAEAAVSLEKFVSPANFLRDAHSKTIVEYNAISALMRLLRENSRAQLPALVLLCHLALHAGNNEALEQARVLNTLEGVDKALLAQQSGLRDLVSDAIYHINLYHTASQRLSFVA